MEGMRLASEVENLAKSFSNREGVDVDVHSADGSARVFVKGVEVEEIGSHWGSAMPVVEPGHPIPYMDMTPREVFLGQWMDDLKKFVSSRGPMSIPDFFRLAQASAKTAGRS